MPFCICFYHSYLQIFDSNKNDNFICHKGLSDQTNELSFLIMHYCTNLKIRAKTRLQNLNKKGTQKSVLRILKLDEKMRHFLYGMSTDYLFSS